jgi:hypothetical protein
MSTYNIGKAEGTGNVFGDGATINNYRDDVERALKDLLRTIEERASELPQDVRVEAGEALVDIGEDGDPGAPPLRRRIQARLARISAQSQNVASVTNAVAQVEQALRHLNVR